MSASAEVVERAISGTPFNPERDYNHVEDAEYKRLRNLAQQEYEKRARCFSDSKQSYNNGNGVEAKTLSELGKEHGNKMDQYNKQAAGYVFRANNADSDADEIDLHGLYVKEAEEFLEVRIIAAKNRGESRLEAIVGKGLHSKDGVAKLKPAVERLCEQHGLRYSEDQKNAGVIVIDLSTAGGYTSMNNMPSKPNKITKPQQAYHGNNNNNYSQQQQPQYVQQNNNNNNNNDNGNNDIVEQIFSIFCMCVKKFLK
ncbi:DUF1771-domain-containing protein [Nadsonia fulvescens var. elongata DSM 6958]|uniref:DUF1771-domain-containing protein n=1 Tax=Nadsonia fulvescens var. elongata DSM 6958 TaxID=857566 RepID=A0A1E3PQW1_9ASCO|nr:DUF1771-domain-containing protein [Nadsonia fulvescens var. elongata DSM 6958]